MYDVIVVGGGPAGLTAARAAAAKGARTLLVEQNAEIGFPIRCGGYLPTPKEIADLLPHARRANKLLDVPKNCILNRTTKVRIISPAGKSWEFKLDGNVIDRERFDKHLALEASKRGVEIRLSTKLIGIHNNKEVIIQHNSKQERIPASVIIGADGVKSKVASLVGLRVRSDQLNYSPTMQYEMRNVNVDPEVVEMYFSKKYAPGAFAWIIPKGGTIANVGLGIRAPFCERGKPLSAYLRNFVQCHPISSIKLKDGVRLATTGDIIPVGGPLAKTYANNVIIAGDAAGHVMASNGGGVPTALVAGDIAGLVAAKYVHGECSLSIYEEMWKREMGNELANAVRIRRLMDLAMKSDSLLERFMERAGGKYMEEMIRCRLPFSMKLALKIIRDVDHNRK